jgi:ABC-2 type transport system ATP-binding protein
MCVGPIELEMRRYNMNFAIETTNLSKSFGSVQAVNAINLRVKMGEIYGFLGLNGAGKTTTIRSLLGMIHPTAGTIQVMGQPVGPHGQGPWREVGHMVETPAVYPELSVKENLEITRRLQGISDKEITARTIEHLKLTPYLNRKAGTLSTGNRQRLGLARALLHQPKLLILDEPTSGLDPAGVVEIREFLASLAHEQGVTIFMSSHILTEVARLATRIGIIHKGCLIEELEAENLAELRSQQLEIKTRNLAAAQTLLTQAGFAVKANDNILTLNETRAIDAPDEVATLLVNAGLPPTRLAVTYENLEDHFLRLTGEK